MNINDRLNTPYPMTNIDEASNTKERILLISTIMFAKKGVAAVSVRDIAEEVGISPAAIYNHFESKEVLWDSILENLKLLYLLYFERLERAFRKAKGYRDVLDSMFAELFEVVDIFTYYGFSLIQTEQLRDEKAYKIYSEIFFTYSIDFIARKFNFCVEQGWAKTFNTRFSATIFMHNVLTGIMMRVHEDGSQTIPYKVDAMYKETYEWLYNVGAVGDI